MKPTSSELEILQILWKDDPLSVRQVNDKLNKSKATGYTTTLKLMQIMFEKGFLSREIQGKKHLYSPVAKEEETQNALLERFLDKTFMGSAQKLIMKALGTHKASQDEIREIKAMLDKIEKKE